MSFDEAATAFADGQGLLIGDPDHRQDETRFVLLGLSAALRLLVVVHRYREADAVVRVISARRASKNECFQYRAR